jgi:hypothetical protein
MVLFCVFRLTYFKGTCSSAYCFDRILHELVIASVKVLSGSVKEVKRHV